MPVELIEEEGPDQRAQRTAERNPALAILEPAAAFGGAPRVLAPRAGGAADFSIGRLY
jgi:hypothetical protein